jgi:predicted RNA binding protein YcfA (HicA-like mRNA interferase family)
LQRITGSHHIYENPEVQKILSIPIHPQSRFESWNLESLDENSPAI